MRTTAPWAIPRPDYPAGEDAAIAALNTIATPDSFVPGQDRNPPADQTPETRLRQWILLSAISDFIEGSEPSSDPKVARERRHIRSVVESWIAGDEGALISFDACCAAFSVAPAAMRRKIGMLSVRQRPSRGEHWLKAVRHDG